MVIRSGGNGGESADAWLASLGATYGAVPSSPAQSDNEAISRLAAELARQSTLRSRGAAGYGEDHYLSHSSAGRSAGLTLAYSSHSGRSTSRKSSANSAQKQEEALQKLIKALADLQQSVENNTGSWGGASGANRNPAQVTSDILNGAAEGAKFGVFGNTAGAIGAGVGGLLGAVGVKGANPYINAITGAAGIYETGAKQGVTVQNVISGAAQGATLGSAFGPVGTAIGAGVGGLLDIFGGLFGRSKPKVPETNTYDPALYNSPSAFDFDAQLYNLTGKFPNIPGQAFNQPANIVQLHVYNDGVQTAVQQVSAAQTTRSATRVASVSYDHTRPQ